MPVTSDQGLRWAASAFNADVQQRYATYYQYMRGDHPMAFATQKFRSAFGSTLESFAYNRMPMIVDALADRLQITGFGSTPNDLAEEWMEIWDANNMDVRSGQVEREKFTTGDAYLIVEQEPRTGDVLLWPQPANLVRVHRADDRPGHIDYATKRWIDEDGFERLTLYYEDRIEKYRSRQRVVSESGTTVFMADNPDKWAPYQPDDDLTWPIRLPVTDTVPVFHFPNNAGLSRDGLGISELHDAIAIQDALNKSVMDLLVAMEFAAFPQRVIVNVDDREVKTQEAIRKFQVGIDRLLTLYGTGEAPVSFGEFAAANIAQYTDVIELFDMLISRVTGVPLHWLRMSGDFPSGEAQRMSEVRLVSKADDRIREDTTTWAEAARYALRLKNPSRQVPPGAIKVNWAPTAPLSEAESIAMGREKLSIGWSQRAVMREMGREEEEIDKILEERSEEVNEAAERRARAFNFGDIDALAATAGGGE